jgi:aminoglycoside phosphotransferase (APT) family kinase protein
VRMPTASFVADVARTLYGLEPVSIQVLDQYQIDGRGIYRIQDAQAGGWVMRLKQDIEEVDALTHTARLLEWLAGHLYPAPVVRATKDQQLVGKIGDWAISMLSYVEGSVLEMTSAADLEAFAQIVGHLHSLRVDNLSSFAPSRCHPDNIRAAGQRLERYHANVPAPFQELAGNLHAAMIALQQAADQQLCITHGDCWYRNAIKTASGQVTLIDWDNVGIGRPLLELGNLLLTSHFDLSRPLVLEPNVANIKAIQQGYQQHSRIAPEERAHIAGAMRFLLAFQLGSYIADETLYTRLDFPFVLEKLQARYELTQPIADIAVQYFDL